MACVYVRVCACACMCMCIWSKLFTFCKYIRKKFLVEAAPHRTEVFWVAVVARPTRDPSRVLDDVLEQLHGAHDILVLHGEWMSGLVRP